MKKISINNKELNLKYTLRAFFIFENMTGYPFRFGKLMDEFILFYSFLLANNESFDIPFDEFVSICEEDLTRFGQFKEFLLTEIKLRSQSAESDVKKKSPETAKKKR